MKVVFFILFALVVLINIGCASKPQPPISLSESFFEKKEKVIGVYMDPLPNCNTHIFGADCLLCLAAASVANSSLTKHFKTLNGNDKLIKEKITLDKLKKYKAEENTGIYARKDYRVLKSQLGLDTLVVIDINTLGAYCGYSSYVRTGDPMGFVKGQIYSIDLNTNEYDLYQVIDEKVSATGDWDEPPSFPGVTNAFYQAIETAKDKTKAFFTKLVVIKKPIEQLSKNKE